MKTTLYMAISANGIIATETGAEDFLSHKNWEKFCELAREFGNFIVGRKIYEAVKKWNGGYNFDDLVGVEKVIISQDQNLKLDEGYTLANSPQDALAKLSQKGFKKVLVTGGANTNSAFANANLLDELVFNVEPIVVGKGIPLFRDKDFERKLKLVGQKKISDNEIRLHYEVLK